MYCEFIVIIAQHISTHIHITATQDNNKQTSKKEALRFSFIYENNKVGTKTGLFIYFSMKPRFELHWLALSFLLSLVYYNATLFIVCEFFPATQTIRKLETN